MDPLLFPGKPRWRPKMASQHVDLDAAPWTSGVPFYGPGAVFEGRDIVQIKLLSDRRREGGGTA